VKGPPDDVRAVPPGEHPRVERPRGIRTRAAWLLVVPFFLLATPTWGGLVVGGLIAALGLAVRAWAAGTIRKDESLTTSGPYAVVRHPLYLGSFLIGIGLALGGGHWAWPAAVVVFFAIVYPPTVREEAERLTELFGHAYVRYAARVPALLPRLRTSAPSAERARRAPEEGRFSWRQYARNREWEALLGAAAAFAVLALRARGS